MTDERALRAAHIRQAFAAHKARRAAAAPAPSPCRAGTELKALLGKFGIHVNEKGCKCKSRAAHMDAAGCDWCEQNIDTIVGWLREEAKDRGLPFVDLAGRMLVRRAIKNARKHMDKA